MGAWYSLSFFTRKTIYKLAHEQDTEERPAYLFKMTWKTSCQGLSVAYGNYLFSFTWKPNHLSGKVNSLGSLLIKNASDSMKFPISEISSPSQDSDGTQWHSGYSQLNHSWNKNSPLPRLGKRVRRQAEWRTAAASLVCFSAKLRMKKANLEHNQANLTWVSEEVPHLTFPGRKGSTDF